MKTDHKKKIENEILKLRRKLEEIEAPKRAAKNAKLVGKCFKYRNRYSDGESWWLYVRIVGVGDFWPKAISFQKTSLGIFEVRTDDTFTNSGGHVQIGRREYNEAWSAFASELLTEAIK